MTTSESAIERARKHWVFALLAAGAIAGGTGWTVADNLYRARLEAAEFQITRLQQDTQTLASVLRRVCGADASTDFSGSACTGAHAPPANGPAANPAPPDPRPKPSDPAPAQSPADPGPAPEPVPADCPKNNTFQCATTLPFGARDSDVFDRESRFYVFDLDRPGRVVLTLNPMPNSRWVDLKVVDSRYTEVHRQRFGAGQPGAVEVTIRSPGRYFVQLDPGSCCSGAPYNYSLALSR